MTLQTSSPAKLKLIKPIQTEGSENTHKLEQSLHQQFHEIRLAGEWFKAEADLLSYIEHL
ncbi:GIY-YIG nuclease family protein [Leptolyngbya sp. AN02str]|uniref:GIY-YIG nuclease family protein n=1 Tax=Leptolyngbya sp. AN02str TaxID=3423363 RepID=UPI003D30FEAC